MRDGAEVGVLHDCTQVTSCASTLGKVDVLTRLAALLNGLQPDRLVWRLLVVEVVNPVGIRVPLILYLHLAVCANKSFRVDPWSHHKRCFSSSLGAVLKELLRYLRGGSALLSEPIGLIRDCGETASEVLLALLSFFLQGLAVWV